MLVCHELYPSGQPIVVSILLWCSLRTVSHQPVSLTILHKHKQTQNLLEELHFHFFLLSLLPSCQSMQTLLVQWLLLGRSFGTLLWDLGHQGQKTFKRYILYGFVSRSLPFLLKVLVAGQTKRLWAILLDVGYLLSAIYSTTFWCVMYCTLQDGWV